MFYQLIKIYLSTDCHCMNCRIGLLRKRDVNFSGDTVRTMEPFNASDKLKDDSDHEKGT